MANINVPNLGKSSPRHIGAFGNCTRERYELDVLAAGSVNGVDLGTGDVIRLGILPAGWELFPHDATIGIPDAFGSGVTGTLGFAYVDGVDVTAVPQDADYFLLSNTLASAAVLRGNNTAVGHQTLPKDAYLILTLGGTAHDASAAHMDVSIMAINRGV